MALNDKIVQDFFNRPRRSPKLIDTNSDIREEATASCPTLSEPKLNHFRVFDDPIKPKNLGQSQDKLRTEIRTKSGQSQDKPRTNLGHVNESIRESSDKLRTEPRTDRRTNLGQMQDKLRTNEGFSALIGLQRKIVLFIYDECKISRAKMTRPLSIEYIANGCQTTKLSAQKSIQRLEQKQIISRKRFKNGRGGWTQYELPDLIFQEIWQSETSDKLRTNLGQTSDNVRTEPKTELRTSVSSSSGSINLNNTTTTMDEYSTKYQLPEEWNNLNIKPLKEIGFSATHLWQIAQQNKLSSTMVQDSIYSFAFDLKRNNKASVLKKGSPLNFFMGILRNGQPYTPPENYQSPQEEALHIYLERKKAQDAQKEKMEKEIFDIHLKEWVETLTEAQIKAIVPRYTPEKGVGTGMIRGLLIEHFKQHEWPNKLTGIISTAS